MKKFGKKLFVTALISMMGVAACGFAPVSNDEEGVSGDGSIITEIQQDNQQGEIAGDEVNYSQVLSASETDAEEETETEKEEPTTPEPEPAKPEPPKPEPPKPQHEFVGTNGVLKDKITGNWYYLVNGKITAGPTIQKNELGWWYINENGVVDFTANTVAKNQYGWWKVTKGKVDFDYTGFADNIYGKWYLEKGKVTFNTTGVIKNNADGNWYYVYNSKVTPGPTVQKNHYGWWYIDETGKVDFKHTGVEKNQYGWWRIENGKVNFNFYGIAENKYGKWFLHEGKVHFETSGVVKINGKWYYLEGDKVIPGPTVQKNQYGWWYINEKGEVDFNANTACANKYGFWRIRGGKVDFGYSGTYTTEYGQTFQFSGGKAYQNNYSNSGLVTNVRLTDKNSGHKDSPVTRITLHHMANVWTADKCGDFFQNSSRQASSNYGIGYDGSVGLYVEEKNRAWASYSRENDSTSVTIEVSNSELGGEWPVSDASYNKLIALCTDICIRNGIKRMAFTGDKRGNFNIHKYFVDTACPGPYLTERCPDIVNKINKKLDAYYKGR